MVVLWSGAVSYERGTPVKGVCCRRMLREGEHALVGTAKGGRLGARDVDGHSGGDC